MPAGILPTLQKINLTLGDIQELIDYSFWVKAMSKKAILIHNSCMNGAPVGDYQAKLAAEKNHAKNQLKIAKKNLEKDNSAVNQKAVSDWKVEFDTKANQIQQDILVAKKQYMLIRQSNWIFVTIYHLIKSKSKLIANANIILSHAIGDKGDPICLIKLDEKQISCPLGFTNFDLDRDGFFEVGEHTPINESFLEGYSGKTDIFDFNQDIRNLIEQCKSKYIVH